MADLVELQELKDFLGVTSVADDDVLDAILAAAEEAFEQQAGRTGRPFLAAQTGREEVRNGTGDDLLHLDYAITTITSIDIGPDPDDPRESLDPDDIAVVAWRENERWIRRVDGGSWGGCDEPNAVRITYDAAADLPRSPALAIKRMAAAIYRQRGAEDVTSEQTSTYLRSLKFGDESSGDTIWDLALRPYRAELR